MSDIGVTAVPVLVVAAVAPGYLIQRVQHYCLVILKPPSKTEMILNAILYSLLVYILFFLFPWSRNSFDVTPLLGSDPVKLKQAIVSKGFLFALIWVLTYTVVVGIPTTILHYHRIPRRALGWLGLRRKDEYLSAWEDFCEKATGKWVELFLKDGRIVRGGLKSVSLPPDEPHVLLTFVAHQGIQYGVEMFAADGRPIPSNPVELLIIKQRDILLSRLLQPPTSTTSLPKIFSLGKRPNMILNFRVLELIHIMILRRPVGIRMYVQIGGRRAKQ